MTSQCKWPIGSKKEKYGSMVFGIMFTVNDVITIAVSAFHLVDEHRPTDSNITWPALLCFSFVYLVLAILENWIYRRIKSSVPFTLCVEDVVTSAIMFGLFISALLLNHISSLWYTYLDHAVAIGLALVLIATDLKILVDIFVYNERPFH